MSDAVGLSAAAPVIKPEINGRDDALGARWNGALVVLFVVLPALFVLPSLSNVNRAVTGDNGDSMLNLWIVDWVADHALSWGELWQGQMFQPHPLTLAYSEALLPQSLLFAVFRWLLPGSDAAAYNAVLLAAFVASLWSTYLLLRRFTGEHVAAVIGSVAWNFSAARLGHIWHFQLLTGGALIPLVILLTLRLTDRPTVGRGLSLGVSLSVLVLSASYYGVMMALAVAVIVLVVLLRAGVLRSRQMAVPLLTAGVVVAALVLPVWHQYSRLQRDPHFRRTPEVQYSTHAEDLLAPAGTTRFLEDIPVIDEGPANVERSLFPGLVTIALAPIGVIALARRRGQRSSQSFDAWLIVGLGVLMLALSAGEGGWLFGIDRAAPYRVVRAVFPPLSGIRAPSRFAIVFQLALSLLAALGLAALLRRVRLPWRWAAAAVVLVLLLFESSVKVPTVNIPDRPAWTAVNHALATRPNGLTAEIPMMSGAKGSAWGFTEAPRQYLARIDDMPRVNGYSGFEPETMTEWADILNSFPSPDAFRLIEDLDLRYLIVRTEIVGEFPVPVPDQLAAALPVLAITPAEMPSIVSIWPELVRDVQQHGAAWLIEFV